MAIKYNKAIIFLLIFSFTFTSISNTSKKNGRKEKLELQLISNSDSCFYNNDTIKLSISLRYNAFWGFIVKKNMDVSTNILFGRNKFDSLINDSLLPYFLRGNKNVTYKYKGPGFIFINIQHNESRYEQIERCGRNASNPKFIIFKNRPYKRNYIINFQKLINADSKTDFIKYRLHREETLNKSWGKYIIQAMYINPKIDTIYSNVINITYLENKQ